MTLDGKGHEASEAFFQARLSPPVLPSGHVSRAHLHADALSGAERVVAVTAPAGYGKTTLLAEWAAAERRPVGWVSLDTRDNDPVELISGLAAAFGPTQGLPTSFWESMSGPSASVLGRLGPRLASAIASAQQPFALIVDDHHEVTSLASHDVIDLVASSVPDGSVLMAAGRVEPPNLPSWRVRLPVFEVGVDQLAFDSEEAARFFELGGATVPDASARDLREKLEGWVAGLQLARIVARQSGEVQAPERFVADYLRSEVLDGMSDEHRQFLVRTSVLGELTGELCDALLGRGDSTRLLDELERANLFVQQLGGKRYWYRCHAAFRDMLAAELERSWGGIERQRLHGVASAWYEQHGMARQAIEHALLAGDPARSANLLTISARSEHDRGRIALVQRWLDQLGEPAILDHPPLMVIAGFSAALTGDAADAERRADSLDRLAAEGRAHDDKSFVSARAMFFSLLCRSGPDQMLADARTALSIEPPWSAWRTTAEGLTAEALLLRNHDGDREEATALFEDAIRSAHQSRIANSGVAWLAERALIAMDDSDWPLARRDLADALRIIDQNNLHDYLVSTLAHAAAARLALHDGDREEAGRQSAKSMRTRAVTTHAVPFWAVRLRLVLGRLHLALGEPVVARHLLQEVDGLLRRRPELGSLVAQARELHDLVGAAPLRGGASPLSTAELRVLPYLQTHLTVEEMAGRLYLSRNTVGTHTKAIYRKLGVASRSEAVEQAVALGLLGDFVGGTTPGRSVAIK